VTYAQLIAGHAPKIAFGIAHWTARGVDDEFMGMLRFEGGLTANIYGSFRAEQRTWLELLGTSGVLTVPNPFRPGPLEMLELERGGKTERIPVEGSPLIFARQVADFEARILDGAPAVVSLDESRRTAVTIAALYQSAAGAMYTQ
jgi:predicted dehydrogenase